MILLTSTNPMLMTLQDNQNEFIDAIAKDIGKPAVMVQGLEIHCVANEVRWLYVTV